MRKQNNLFGKRHTRRTVVGAWLDDTQINVKVDDGRVILTGAVPTYADFVEATDKTWGISGVTSVDNELLVGTVGETLVDTDLAARCMDALAADRIVPQGAVTVDVLDGWVTLGGHVQGRFPTPSSQVCGPAGERGAWDH